MYRLLVGSVETYANVAMLSCRIPIIAALRVIADTSIVVVVSKLVLPWKYGVFGASNLAIEAWRHHRIAKQLSINTSSTNCLECQCLNRIRSMR